MAIEQYTYWSITINNPDENDYLITRNPNPKYIREMIWTPEVGGEEGTPHIQGWVRLQRNQTQAFMKKLYPRAHLKPCRKDDYNENCHQYAQKNDETTAGNHHISLNDPLPAADSILYKVLDAAWDRLLKRDDSLRDRVQHEGLKGELWDPHMNLKMLWTDVIEREMIMERSGLEKIFCSPSYEKMKKAYWKEIIFRLKQNASEDSTGSSLHEEDEGKEGEEDSQTLGSSESGSVGSSETDDLTESGEQADW